MPVDAGDDELAKGERHVREEGRDAEDEECEGRVDAGDGGEEGAAGVCAAAARGGVALRAVIPAERSESRDRLPDRALGALNALSWP